MLRNCFGGLGTEKVYDGAGVPFVISALFPRLLVLTLVVASAITAGATPQSAHASVTNNDGNWATGEWVCSTGTPPMNGNTYFIGVEYDCTLTATSGRVMTARSDNSWGVTTVDVRNNLTTFEQNC